MASVRGTPFRSIGPNGNSGVRGGGDGNNTVPQQYRDGGINTVPAARGTPEQYKVGNADNARRVASSDRQGGKVVSENGIDMNNPAANGTGVIFDGTTNVGDGHEPPHSAMLDSPVPGGSPQFDTTFIPIDARARLGNGNESGASETLLAGNGVMSRGMVGTSTPGGPEDELMTDDTLPSVAPA